MLSGHQTRWPNDKMLVHPTCWVVQHLSFGRAFTHLLSQNSPLSKMADYYKREAWALSTSTLISTEEAHFHGGGSFLRRKLISTEEAHFYGGSCFIWRKADFYGGD